MEIKMLFNASKLTVFLMTVVLLANALHSSCASAQADNVPLVSMRMLIVNEFDACRLENGYDDIQPGVKCPQLTSDYVSSLKGTVAETQYSPPGEIVSLGLGMFKELNGYREVWRRALDKTGLQPPLKDRKSIILIFDFENAEQHSKQDLDVVLERRQVGRNCKLEPSKTEKGDNCQKYRRTVPSDSRYLVYHEGADSFIPVSKVTWTLSATEKVSGRKYPSWKFETAR
jgi:hypothetical protein